MEYAVGLDHTCDVEEDGGAHVHDAHHDRREEDQQHEALPMQDGHNSISVV